MLGQIICIYNTLSFSVGLSTQYNRYYCYHKIHFPMKEEISINKILSELFVVGMLVAMEGEGCRERFEYHRTRYPIHV